MSRDNKKPSRWGDNALSNLTPKEKKERINEHNTLVRRYNRELSEEEDSNENEHTFSEDNTDEEQVDEKKCSEKQLEPQEIDDLCWRFFFCLRRKVTKN